MPLGAGVGGLWAELRLQRTTARRETNYRGVPRSCFDPAVLKLIDAASWQRETQQGIGVCFDCPVSIGYLTSATNLPPSNQHCKKPQQLQATRCLDAQLGTAPMTPLGVVADLVVRPQADPLRDRPGARRGVAQQRGRVSAVNHADNRRKLDAPVLLRLLGEHQLGPESLERRHC